MSTTNPPMSPGRRLGIELFLGVAGCMAGTMLLVDPAASALARAREEMSTLTAQSGQAGQRPAIPAERAPQILKDANERLAAIAARSTLAKDQAVLFGALISLADRHRIHVDQVQPAVSNRSKERRAAPPAPSAAPAPDPGAPAVESACVRYSIVATGGYADLTRFIDGLQADLGFTRVRSLRMDPVRDASPPTVQVIIETEHFAFGAGAAAIAAAAEAKP